MMRRSGHRVLIGGQDVVGLGIVAVGVPGTVGAGAIGRGHRERLGSQDVVGRLAVKVPVSLADRERLGGQDVVGLVRVARARHGPACSHNTLADRSVNNLSRTD
jgi:hypothetical protein